MKQRREIGARPGMPVVLGHVTRASDAGRSFIDRTGLQSIVDRLVGLISRLESGEASITEVAIDHESDPEIDGFEVLAITVWARAATAADGMTLWSTLWERIERELPSWPAEERKRFRRLVSVGVDLE